MFVSVFLTIKTLALNEWVFGVVVWFGSDRVSVWSPSWPCTCHSLPASASQVRMNKSNPQTLDSDIVELSYRETALCYLLLILSL